MESKAHIKAKERLAQILRSQSDFQNVEIERKMGVMTETDLGPREYLADIYCQFVYQESKFPGAQFAYVKIWRAVCIEIDGKHHSKKSKDNYRDQKLREAGITTIRFRLSDLVGKKSLKDDSVFLEEIRQALQK